MIFEKTNQIKIIMWTVILLITAVIWTGIYIAIMY